MKNKLSADSGAVISFLIALMAATATAVPRGLDVSVLLVFFYSIFHWKKWQLSNFKQYNWLFVIFIIAFLSGITSVFYDGSPALDEPSRYLLALPLVLMLPCSNIRLEWILKGFIIGGILSGLVALYQCFFLGFERAEGYVLIINFGVISAIKAVMAICALIIFKRDSIVWSLLALLSIVLALTATVLSGTRGAWLIVPPVTIFILALHNNLFKFKSMLICALITVVACLLVYTVVPAVKDRTDLVFNEISLYSDGSKRTSIGERFELWRAAIREFQESPVFGLGFKRRSEYRKQLIAEGYLVSTDGHGSAHNELFDALAKRGLFGVLAILLLYFIPFGYFARHYRVCRDPTPRMTCICGMAFIASFMIAGLTERFLFHHTASMFFMFCLSAFWGKAQKSYDRVEC